MATGWVRSLHCKSNVLQDVVSSPATPSKKPLLPLSCASSSGELKDSVRFLPQTPPVSSIPPKPTKDPSCSKSKSKSEQRIRPKSKKPAPLMALPPSPMATPVANSTSFLSLTELPEGHSSRRVVEIIFNSSWPGQFAGKIEMLFRVHNPARIVSRFEEHRDSVRARAGRSGYVRCAADGNEMMRFHCRGGAAEVSGGEPVYDAGVTTSAVAVGGRMVEGVRTFAGSAAAHENAGGGAGRRAMLVCRVIAGRVGSICDQNQERESDSVCIGKGEIIVFDSRAVLPCFLIIYKV